MKGPWLASARLSIATDAASDTVILITALISVARHADVAAKTVGHHVNLACGLGRCDRHWLETPISFPKAVRTNLKYNCNVNQAYIGHLSRTIAWYLLLTRPTYNEEIDAKNPKN